MVKYKVGFIIMYTIACVAQLVVQLIRNEQVAGSSPVTSSSQVTSAGQIVSYFVRYDFFV